MRCSKTRSGPVGGTELEYGVTVVPLLILAVGAGIGIARPQPENRA